MTRIPLCPRIDMNETNLEIAEQINSEYDSDILLIGSIDPQFVPVGEDCDEMGCKRVRQEIGLMRDAWKRAAFGSACMDG